MKSLAHLRNYGDIVKSGDASKHSEGLKVKYSATHHFSSCRLASSSLGIESVSEI